MPRGRIRNLIDNANRATVHANTTMHQADALLKLAEALIEDIKDGVRVTLIHEGEGSINDFILGRTKVCPIQLKVEIDEPERTET